jgi:membrane fusion protein, multidrug efflux system
MPLVVRMVMPLLLLATSALAQGGRATPVIVAEVRQEPLREEIALVGIVRPRHTTQVASESEGIVQRRFTDGGQTVQAGDVLYQLSNDPLRADLAEARADFKLNKANYARSVELLATDAASEQELQNDEYEMERARAKMQRAESLVSNLRIRAPFSGHIIQTLTEVGAWVGRGQAVAHLVSTDTVRVYVNAPERHVPHIRIGDTAQIQIEAIGGEAIEGKVVAILAEGYAESHSFPVVVEMPNPQGLMRSNMSAEVRFTVRQPGESTLVHKDALVNSPMGQVVFLAIDGKAVSRPVRAGLSYNGFIAVEGQLEQGDLAVVRGNERLQDGQELRILRKQQ